MRVPRPPAARPAAFPAALKGEDIRFTLKKKYAHLGVSERRQLRSLEDENNRLRRLVADLSLDKHILTVKAG